MPASQVQWSLPIGVLAIGLVVGVILVWRQLRSARGGARQDAPTSAVPGSLPLELRDLAGRRDALVQQLRELDDTAAKRSPAQLARERYALELEAARVLRDLERHPSARAARATARGAALAQAAPVAAVAGGGTVKGFVWGLAIAAMLGGLMFYVSQSAQPRDPGGQLTGNLPQSGGGSAPASEAPAAAPGAEEQGLRAAIAKNPDDFDARIGLAQALLGRQDMMGVWTETQYVLERQPGEPRALAYQALVRVAMGQAEQAEQMLKQAIQARPDLLEGYVHLALVYRRLGRDADSEKAMADALQRFPQQRNALTAVFEQIRTGVRPQAATEGEAHTQADAAPASGGPAPGGAAPAAADAGRRLAGVIELDPALLGQVPPGTTLFITVREARVLRGPPAAVKRLSVASFPLRFELSDQDSMAGEPLPDPARVEARLDGDGNAMTREPGDAGAVEDGVRIGATSLRLVLRRQ